MKLNNDTMIEVFNYGNTIVLLSKTNPLGITLWAGTEDEPSVEWISFMDLKYNKSNSSYIQTGKIQFDPELADEIYKALKIYDKSNILPDKDLKNIILDDSIDNLKRIDSFKSIDLLIRLKQLIIQMSANNILIPNNVIRVLDEKYNEMSYRVRNNNKFITKLIEKYEKKLHNEKTAIELEQIKNEKEQFKAENEKVLEQNRSLMEQMQEMMKQMQELQNQVNNSNIKQDTQIENENVNTNKNTNKKNKSNKPSKNKINKSDK